MPKKLKLFVWENVLIDHSAGIMFALAPDAETARKLIIQKEGPMSSVLEGLGNKPRTVEVEEGFAIWGSQ